MCYSYIVGDRIRICSSQKRELRHREVKYLSEKQKREANIALPSPTTSDLLSIFSFLPRLQEKLIQSAKTALGADCGSDHDSLLQNSLKLKKKKIGKTTRPFRYGLNQIPYDYTAEVTNRFKGTKSD